VERRGNALLSLYFQQVLHESPVVTGLAIAPQGMAGFTAGLYGTQLAAGFGGVRRLLTVSLTGVTWPLPAH
jgi:hypothetical protein